MDTRQFKMPLLRSLQQARPNAVEKNLGSEKNGAVYSTECMMCGECIGKTLEESKQRK